MPEVTSSPIPFLAVAVSLSAVPLILLSARWPNLREGWTIGASLAKFGLVLSLLPDAFVDKVVSAQLIEIAPSIHLELKADPLGVYFALIASGLWVLTSFYSIGYVRGLAEHKQTRYFASFALCLAATIGIAFAANLLTFLVFYELLTIATYPLVIHKETPEAISAGRKYLAYTLTAGVALIAATAWLYQIVGRLDFVPGGVLSKGAASSQTIMILFLLFLGGVGVKAAIMPLHSWLPTAMAAPTPVSALLHAVAVVKSGVFGVMRLVGFVFGPETMRTFRLNEILLVLTAATILFASLLALREDNLKRRLAYSTVGHLSYIVLGAALLSPNGFAGGLLHIATHATMKITLFFCAGAIYVTLHKEQVSELDGVGKAMPWTMGAFTIGALGLAGIPPVNGFVSKWFLGIGTLEVGSVGAFVILLVSGLLNAGYFFPIIHRAFFRESRDHRTYTEASVLMVAPTVAAAILSLLFGVWPNLFVHFQDLSLTVVTSVFGGVR